MCSGGQWLPAAWAATAHRVPSLAAALGVAGGAELAAEEQVLLTEMMVWGVMG